MDNSKLTGNKNILYKISETEIPPSSTVSFKKQVQGLFHHVPILLTLKSPLGSITRMIRLLWPRKGLKYSVLYSTLKHMSICCRAADHCEVQMPLSSFYSVIWCQQTRTYMFLPEMVCTRVFKYHSQAEVGLLTRINGQTEPEAGFLQASPSTV